MSRLCSSCVLPETFPGMDLDSSGVCSHCRAALAGNAGPEQKNRYREKFEALAGRFRGADYDVLAAFSGGKDSTFTLDIFKNRFGLRVLALTFDNGFLSPYSVKNITRVVETLGIDHIMYKPNFQLLKKLFTISAGENLFAKKSLERASSICSACMHLVKLLILKIALEKKIPFIGYGWSPGQVPMQSSVMKVSAEFIKATQNILFNALNGKLGDAVNLFFLDSAQLAGAKHSMYNIYPLAFLEYDEHKIYQRIRELGWEPPQDTDSNSTNCLLNAFAIEIHQKAYGFHPYAFEIAGLVRRGVLSREEGIKRLNTPGNAEVIRMVKERLGLA